MRRWTSTWRLAVRMSWRGLRRAPQQSLLLVLIVSLPVASAIGYAAVARSVVPTPDQLAERTMGTAQVLLAPATQVEEPESFTDASRLVERAQRVAGSGSRATPDTTLAARFSVGMPGSGPDQGQVGGTLRLLDLEHPLTRGMYHLEAGSVAAGAGISVALARRLGVGPGQEVAIASLGRTVRVGALLLDRQDTDALFLVTAGTAELYDAAYAAAGSGRVRTTV